MTWARASMAPVGQGVVAHDDFLHLRSSTMTMHLRRAFLGADAAALAVVVIDDRATRPRSSIDGSGQNFQQMPHWMQLRAVDLGPDVPPGAGLVLEHRAEGHGHESASPRPIRRRSFWRLSLAHGVLLTCQALLVGFLGRGFLVVLGLDGDRLARWPRGAIELGQAEDPDDGPDDGRVDDGRGQGAELVLDGDLGGVDRRDLELGREA